MSVRTRFAPSPTGSLHVGGARTALYCWLYAHKKGGQFLLRIEDTDQARSTEEAAIGILRDLRWLGLDWDEGPGTADPHGVGPFYQSQRLAMYDQYVQELLAKDLAYEAWDSNEELDALRKAAEAEKKTLRYRRRSWTEAEIAAFRAEGRRPVVRLDVPRIARTIPDLILGDVTVSEDDVDDFVIRKADGFPTYHFAVVVDDHFMQVTTVLRGQEHLMNTAKHQAILTALGWSFPDWGHFPLIFNPTGTKMSKRDKAKAARDAAKAAIQAGRTAASFADVTSFPLAEIEAFLAKKNDGVALATALAADLGVDLPNIEVMDFRKSGFVPEALLNYLSLLGWNPGGDEEIWAVADMVERFDLPDVGRSAARFDYDKLRAMNGTWLRKLPREQILAHLASFHEVRSSRLQALDAPTLDRVLDLFLPRARTFVELAHQASQLLDRPASYDAKSLDKHVRPDAAFLPTLADGLASLDDWTPAGLEAGLNALAASTGVGLGKIAQPLRVALTGSSASPSIHDCLALVGQGETLARVNALRAAVSA